MHTGDQGGVRGLRGEGEGVLGGTGGAGVGAHVHVGADDAGVEQEEGVGVVQSAAVELVEGGFDEVDGVAQLTGEVVRHGPAAQCGHPGGQRGVGVREDLLGALEVPPGGVDFPDVDVAVAEPEQRRRPFLGEPERVRLREQRGVLLGRGLGFAGGEGALGLGQSHPQGRDEVRGPSGGELLEGDAEPVGDVPQRLVGGAHPSRLQGGDVRGGVRRLRQLSLRQPTIGPQLLDSSPDRPRIITVRHAQRPQLPLCPLPFDSDSP